MFAVDALDGLRRVSQDSAEEVGAALGISSARRKSMCIQWLSLVLSFLLICWRSCRRAWPWSCSLQEALAQSGVIRRSKELSESSEALLGVFYSS